MMNTCHLVYLEIWGWKPLSSMSMHFTCNLTHTQFGNPKRQIQKFQMDIKSRTKLVWCIFFNPELDRQLDWLRSKSICNFTIIKLLLKLLLFLAFLANVLSWFRFLCSLSWNGELRTWFDQLEFFPLYWKTIPSCLLYHAHQVSSPRS